MPSYLQENRMTVGLALLSAMEADSYYADEGALDGVPSKLLHTFAICTF